MSALARIKKTAAQHEQERQYDKALALYARLLDGAEAGGEEVDVALFNRAGDLALRLGDAPRAVGYFERALDLYAAAGLLNNAVALGVKILRHAPHHLSAHYTLGVLYGRKGFVGDSRQHLLTYAVQMQRAGRVDETTRVLAEVAAGCGDATELRAAHDAYGAMGGDAAYAVALAGGVAATPGAAAGDPAAARAAAAVASAGPEFLDLSTPVRESAPAARVPVDVAAAAAAPGFDFLGAAPDGIDVLEPAADAGMHAVADAVADPIAASGAVLFDALPERTDAVDLDLLPGAGAGGVAEVGAVASEAAEPLVFLDIAGDVAAGAAAFDAPTRLDLLPDEPPPLRLAELADVAGVARPRWGAPGASEPAPGRFADLLAVELGDGVALPTTRAGLPPAVVGDARASMADAAPAAPSGADDGLDLGAWLRETTPEARPG
jgi:hypothetical protein